MSASFPSFHSLPARAAGAPPLVSQSPLSAQPASTCCWGQCLQLTEAALHSLASKGVSYLHHKELKPPVPLNRKENLAYYRIANHYKFIMQTFFDCLRVPRLIILEVSSATWWRAGWSRGSGTRQGSCSMSGMACCQDLVDELPHASEPHVCPVLSCKGTLRHLGRQHAACMFKNLAEHKRPNMPF